MKLITNTFVLVAPDCKLTAGTAPKPRESKPTIAFSQHDFLLSKPYKLTLEDLMFKVHCQREKLTAAEAKKRKAEIQEKLYGKPYPCMRASPLPKTYGWGIHHDSRGRIAIYGMETQEYQDLADSSEELEVVVAMRTKREE